MSDYIAILWKHRLLVALIGLCLIGGTFAFSFLAPARYSAQTTVLLRTEDNQDLFPRPPATTESLLIRNAAIEVEFARSDAVGTRADQLPADTSILIQQSKEGDTLVFRALGNDPLLVAELANSYADDYLTARAETLSAQLAQLLTAVDASVLELLARRDEIRAPLVGLLEAVAVATDPETVTELDAQISATREAISPDLDPIREEAAVLSSQKNGLELLIPFMAENDDVTAKVLEVAAPGVPAGPFLARNLVLAVLLAGVLGISAALVAESFDERITTVADIERAAPGRRVLSTFHGVGHDTDLHVAWPDILDRPHIQASVGNLITNLQSVMRDEPLGSIQVVEAVDNGRRNPLAVLLAMTTQRAHTSTILVDGDLHRADLGRTLRAPTTAGFSNVVTGRSSASDALVTVPESWELQFLGAGSADLTPLAATRRANDTDLLADLTGLAALVIVDSPPVLSAPDSIVLGAKADVTILVVRERQTKVSELAGAIDVLDWAGIRVAGIVLLDRSAL